MELPKGYQAKISVQEDLGAKGLIVSQNTFIGARRVCFRVRNIGKEIIPINHGDKIATLEIMPYFNIAWEEDNELQIL